MESNYSLQEETGGQSPPGTPHRLLSPGAAQCGFETPELRAGSSHLVCSLGFHLPCRLLPLVLVQVGGGEVWGLTTGANALFCFTAETMLAGEKEKIPEELLQLEGRLVEEAIVGLDGTTRREKKKKTRKGIP